MKNMILRPLMILVLLFNLTACDEGDVAAGIALGGAILITLNADDGYWSRGEYYYPVRYDCYRSSYYYTADNREIWDVSCDWIDGQFFITTPRRYPSIVMWEY
jgi:hypothetical protein